MGGLYLSPCERRCADKFYILCGALYRLFGNEDKAPLTQDTKLMPLLELCKGMDSTSVLEVTGSTVNIEGQYIIRTLFGIQASLPAAGSVTVRELKDMYAGLKGGPQVLLNSKVPMVQQQQQQQASTQMRSVIAKARHTISGAPPHMLCSQERIKRTSSKCSTVAAAVCAAPAALGGPACRLHP